MRILLDPFYELIVYCLQVTLGARFPPCMKLIPDVPPTMTIGCANATSDVLTADVACTIEEICGFGGFRTSSPTIISLHLIPVLP